VCLFSPLPPASHTHTRFIHTLNPRRHDRRRAAAGGGGLPLLPRPDQGHEQGMYVHPPVNACCLSFVVAYGLCGRVLVFVVYGLLFVVCGLKRTTPPKISCQYIFIPETYIISIYPGGAGHGRARARGLAAIRHRQAGPSITALWWCLVLGFFGVSSRSVSHCLLLWWCLVLGFFGVLWG
jgi:hypothetical protein